MVIGKKRHGKKRQVKNVMVKIDTGKKRHRKKRQKFPIYYKNNSLCIKRLLIFQPITGEKNLLKS